MVVSHWHSITSLVRGNDDEGSGHEAVFSIRSDVNVCGSNRTLRRGSLLCVLSAWSNVDEPSHLR
jgi:hypothetical protein